MEYRREYKYILSLGDAMLLRERLGILLKPDPHAAGGSYRITSLYFDSPDAMAYREKTDGTDERSKYRLRYYNGVTDRMMLENKVKRGNLTGKEAAALTEEQAEMLLRGETEFLLGMNGFCTAFYARSKSEVLRPSVTVDYIRYPYVFDADRVRITIDTDVRAGNPGDFLKSGRPPFPVLDSGTALLEVKSDDRFPSFLLKALEDVPHRQQATSKFALCAGLMKNCP